MRQRIYNILLNQRTPACHLLWFVSPKTDDELCSRLVNKESRAGPATVQNNEEEHEGHRAARGRGRELWQDDYDTALRETREGHHNRLPPQPFLPV